ncbi:MAG: iron ABC transporter permease [Oscillospiraceae bacterium]|nr:iron ABC transporter permease [Oscillospiraceae bacterium]MDY6208244.1 iron ABC transporter permease [Oscillospiraceae bacterium]
MKKETKHYILGFTILVLLLLFLMAASLFSGSVSFSPEEVIKVLTGAERGTTAANIILSIRLPRLLAAMVLGGGLAVSGYLLQTYFANPIAGPFVLGISSGAKLTVAMAMIFFLQRGIPLTSAALIISSFAGSMLSMGFILAVSPKIKRSSMLVVCGVMIGYICSGITDIAVTFADDSNIVNLHSWSMGSFSGIDSEDVKAFSPVIFICLGAAFLMSKQINAYRLGEVYAQSSGVNIKAFRVGLILVSSLLSAAVTAFAGPVSFVGIAVPHLIKKLFKTADPKLIIPAAFLGGGVFCLMCDLPARILFAPSELSISSVTALAGAPVVIAIMAGRHREQ